MSAGLAVAGLSDERWGRRVVALSTTRDGGAPLDAHALDAHCRSSDLPNFKRPREYVFVAEIPNPPSARCCAASSWRVSTRPCRPAKTVPPDPTSTSPRTLMTTFAPAPALSTDLRRWLAHLSDTGRLAVITRGVKLRSTWLAAVAQAARRRRQAVYFPGPAGMTCQCVRASCRAAAGLPRPWA